MGLIFVTLVLGFLVGKFCPIPERFSWVPSRITLFSLLALIFVMGIQIGANPQVIQNLGRLGIQGLTLALGATAGSVLLVYLFAKYLSSQADVERLS